MISFVPALLPCQTLHHQPYHLKVGIHEISIVSTHTLYGLVFYCIRYSQFLHLKVAPSCHQFHLTGVSRQLFVSVCCGCTPSVVTWFKTLVSFFANPHPTNLLQLPTTSIITVLSSVVHIDVPLSLSFPMIVPNTRRLSYINHGGTLFTKLCFCHF